jgi:hypothetical protein
MRHNDAVRYPSNNLRQPRFTWDEFNNLIKALEATDSYKMIVFDTFGTQLLNKEAIAKIEVKGE